MAQTKTRTTLERLLEDLHWQRTTPGVMEANLAELRARVAASEARYGMTAEQAHEAIERRELVEDLDVCNWLLDARALQRVDGR